MVNRHEKLSSDYNLICHTCKSSIDDCTSRFLIVKDKIFQKHKLLSFHYFFPCWDIDYVCKILKDCEISKAGFFCDRSVLKNPLAVKNMRRNEDLWDLEITI